MTSLEDAYSGRGVSRRVLAGGAMLTAGALAIIAAIGFVWLGNASTTVKLYAGLSAGVGVPAMLLGVVVVLPASRRQRLGVITGTVLAGAGISLFWYAYPARWTRTSDPLAFETLLVYGIGCAIALWFVFSAIASTRLRNNPHGTVSLEVIRQGETKTVEVSHQEYQHLISDGGDPESYIKELQDRD